MVGSLIHSLFSDFEMQLRKGNSGLMGLVFSKAHCQGFKARAGSPFFTVQKQPLSSPVLNLCWDRSMNLWEQLFHWEMERFLWLVVLFLLMFVF